MAERIAEGLWRLDIPLEGNPMKNLNSYLLTGPRSLLIDTGFRQDPCRAAMERQLEEIGVDRDRLDIFLTHLHSDHTGLVPELIRPGCRVYIGRVDGARLTDKSEPDTMKARDAVREKYGLTEENLALFDAWERIEDGKKQIVFVPNIPAEDDGILLEIDDETTADQAFSSHSERMGRYAAAFDGSGTIQSVGWTHEGEELPDVTESTWGRASVYGAECLTELEKLLADLKAIRMEYPDDGWTRTPAGDARLDERMVAAGFSATRYNHVLPESGMLGERDALALARQALASDDGVSAEWPNDPESVTYAVCQKEEGKTVWNVWFHSAEGISVVTLDAADGTILDVIVDTGMAGNG